MAPADEARGPRPPRTFGLKDLFTCINVLGGVFCVIFCIQDKPRYAAYAFLAGYFIGDALDGLVARATNTGNAFGREFDIIADHMAQCVGPAMIVFITYRDATLPGPLHELFGATGSFAVGAALASLLIITGSVRHARSAVASADFPMAYVGLPRTVSSFIIISYLNSSLVQFEGALWGGVVLLILVAIANIVPLPYRTHRGRRLVWWVRLLVLGFFVTTGVALLFFRDHVFDVTLFWLFGYAAVGWFEMQPDELRDFFAHAREWSERVRSAR